MGGFEDPYGVVAIGRAYPHNLFLEMLAETGLVGCLLGTGFVFTCLVQIWRKSEVHSRYWRHILPLWLYAILLAMVSLDIAGNAPVFYYPLGVVLAGSFARPGLFTVASQHRRASLIQA